MRSLRGFMVELEMISDPLEREVELLRRRQEITDPAHDNRRSISRPVGKSLASWSPGLTGSVWFAATGDVLGAAVGTLGVGTGLMPSAKETAGAYSYLFAVTGAFGQSRE